MVLHPVADGLDLRNHSPDLFAAAVLVAAVWFFSAAKTPIGFGIGRVIVAVAAFAALVRLVWGSPAAVPPAGTPSPARAGLPDTCGN